MFFKQFRNEGCLSYIIADEITKECAVIDPAKETGQYLEALENYGSIKYIIDTHSHADHVTGAGELSISTGGKVVMSRHVDKQRAASEGKGDEIGIGDILRENSSVAVAKKVSEGDELEIGNISLEVIETAGHTLDSMCLLMEYRVFSGDTLMIGLCGRTDLPGGSTEMMYNSIFEKLHTLEDDLLVYPAHDYKGNINSSVGYEKMNNPFFKQRKPGEFVEFVKKAFPPPKGSGMQCGVMDTKAAIQEPGATGPLMKDMCVAMEKFFRDLPRDWKNWNVMDVRELKKKLDAGENVFVLDVRTPGEYKEYHIKGARNIPVKEIPGRINELPKDRDADIVTQCDSGFRSAHAAIFLKAYGYTNVKNLEHGIRKWLEEGYDVER
ncbi:MAG: MBL fold metallo-hydrolase [Candidatus Methanoperedenaceae archaeon]|nr:MBL fold metallo-hydrolase [Candidatus Methanoperedenaceae archaeon]MDW7726573.1 MBL fold metallo-hydrolase [Candidatus Methanoperedens sp.]